MPIYEYHCGSCQHDFECLVRGNESPVCPNCKGTSLEKQFSLIATPASQSSQSLPVCQPQMPSGGCGLPQCGTGGCEL